MDENNVKRVVKYSFIMILIIIVVALLTMYIRNIIKKEKIKEMQSDLLQVQAKVEIVKGKNSVSKDENPLRGVQLSKINEKLKIASILEKFGITAEELESYYMLRESDFDAMELGDLKGKYDGLFFVNYNTFEVVYTGGYINTKGVKCYKVSEMNKEPETEKKLPIQEQNVQEQPAQTEQTTETGNNAETETKTE